MKKRLVIIGAGNVGGFLSYNIADFGNFDLLGFLDDDRSKVGKEIFGHKVLGTISELEYLMEPRDLSVVVGIASPKSKKTIIDRLSKYPLAFPSFIGKNVWFSKGVEIGKGAIIYPGVAINYGSLIGDFVSINMNCAIGHDCTVSNFSTLAPGVSLAGFTYVDEGANLGIGVSTRQNVRIGKFATIGGQTMLLNDAPANSLVVGVPGRCLK